MSGTALDRLKEGARRFRTEQYPALERDYLYAAQHPQRPHSLVIACSDSRVAIEKIVGWKPGEVFVTRNVGNLVPAFGQSSAEIAAVVEYAVAALEVQHILICGHSDCGAMKAVLHPESVESLPAVKRWLTNAQAALPRARARCSCLDDDLLPCLTEQNVLLQLEQLKTHPAVASALERGALTVSGWVYEIGSGAVRIAADGEPPFHPLNC